MRRFGIAGVIIAALLFGSAQTSVAQTSFPSGCIGYCGNGIAIGIGITAGAVATLGIVFAVNHSHHFLTGCVSNGADGLELRANDTKTYALEVEPSAVKVGDRIKFRGSKLKKSTNNKGEQVFKVDRLKKDYGPCHAAPATGEAAASRTSSNAFEKYPGVNSCNHTSFSVNSGIRVINIEGALLTKE